MNLNKHLEFIEPASFSAPIHIIGVGAVGSRVAEVLARLGYDNFHIYDFDIVEDANITNQLYTHKDLGQLKTVALLNHLRDINPLIKVTSHGAYEKQYLSGAVFLAVDSINTRRRITEQNLQNLAIEFIADGRMRLTDAQAYTAAWRDPMQANAFLGSMDFDDKDDTTPLSVCGSTLSVAPTVLTLASSLVMNFIRYQKKLPIKQVIFLDMMEMQINAFTY